MIYSMTGFGRSAGALSPRFHVAVTAKSVNHRFLETSVRLPEYLWELESLVRAIASEAFSRGKLDISIRVQRTQQPEYAVRTHCPYCAYQCGVLMGDGDGYPDRVQGDPHFPVNNGQLCVKGWTSDMVALRCMAIDNPGTYRGGEVIHVITASSRFSDPSLGFFALLRLPPPFISAAHSERAIGPG